MPYLWIQVAVAVAVSILKPPHSILRSKRRLRGRFRSEKVIHLFIAVLCNGHFHNGRRCPFGCNGYVTAVAVGQSQRLYYGSGARVVFTIPGVISASSTYIKGVDLRSRPLMCNTSGVNSSLVLGVFRTHFYNHARRLRLRLVYLGLSRSPNGQRVFKAASGSRFPSETAAR